MNLSGKKLTTAILAGLMGATMFGGSVFAEVSDQEFNEVRQGVNSNTERISQLENAQSTAKDYSTDIAANKKAIADETKARQDADTKLQGSVDANAKAIANEATARTEADTKLDTRITNVKDYLEKQTAADYVSKTDAAVQEGAVAKAGNTIGENVTNLDSALAKETAARIGADKAQDKVIQTVNDNLVQSVNTINQNVAAGFKALNQADANEATTRDAADQAEAKARDVADQKLQDNIDAETTARQTDVANLQKNITDSLINQGKINETLTTTATNLEKHLSDTDGRVDKANAEIHTNAGNIAQSKQDIADIQDTLKKANALATKAATEAATQAASDATAAAKNANDVADGLKDRVDLISNNQNVTSESDLIKKDKSIGQNLTKVDAALHNEIAARIGADKAQDEVIKKVNQNVAKGFNDLNQNIGKITDQLNKNDFAEAQTRAAADQKLQGNIDAEAKARTDADTKLDTRITNVKEYLQNETEKNYVSKGMYNRETSVADGAFVKEGQTVGQNLNAVDKGLNDEIAARIGADAAQDKVIKQVNDNLVSSVNTINKNVADGFNALSAVDLQEAQTRAAADKTLQDNIDAEAGARDKADQKEAATRQAADQNLQNQINNNSTSINDLYGRYSSLKTDINKVGARSAALAGLHPLDFDPANKLNFAVASGSFKGENSVALGAFYRPNENIMFSAASTMGDSDNAYTFGLSFKIGPSSAKTKTTSPDAEELYKVVGELQDQLAAQQKEIEQLKADKAK